MHVCLPLQHSWLPAGLMVRRPIRHSLAVAGLLLACGEVDDTLPEKDAIIDLREGSRTIPAVGQTSVTFTRVREAKFLPNGGIAVLDASDPFAWIFGPTGLLEARFIPFGGGPGEAYSTRAIAVTDDSEVIVAHDRNRLTVFSREGTRLRSSSIPIQMSVRVLESACQGNEIFAYGRLGDSAVAVVVQSTSQASPIRVDSELAGTYIPWRHPGFSASNGSSIVWFAEHDLLPAVKLLDCKSGRITTVQDSVTPEASSAASNGGPVPGRANETLLSVKVGTGPFPAGLARSALVTYWAEWHGSPGEPIDRRTTIVYSIDANQKNVIGRIYGWYYMHDYSSDHGFLLSTEEPVPSVVIADLRR